MQTCDTVNEHRELSVDMQAALIVFFSVVIGCQFVSIMITLKQTRSVEPSAYLWRETETRGRQRGRRTPGLPFVTSLEGLPRLCLSFL